VHTFIYRVRFSVSVSALIALALGLCLTAIVFASARKLEVEQHNQQFQQNAKLRANAVTSGLQDAVDQVRVLNQFFRVVGVVSREQFHAFGTPLLERNPSIQALSFQRVVLQRDRPAYEAAMQRLYPNFRITEVINGKIQNCGFAGQLQRGGLYRARGRQ
jgi:CHASE1-domain containing sensor protein